MQAHTAGGQVVVRRKAHRPGDVRRGGHGGYRGIGGHGIHHALVIITANGIVCGLARCDVLRGNGNGSAGRLEAAADPLESAVVPHVDAVVADAAGDGGLVPRQRHGAVVIGGGLQAGGPLALGHAGHGAALVGKLRAVDIHGADLIPIGVAGSAAGAVREHRVGHLGTLGQQVIGTLFTVSTVDVIVAGTADEIPGQLDAARGRVVAGGVHDRCGQLADAAHRTCAAVAEGMVERRLLRLGGVAVVAEVLLHAVLRTGRLGGLVAGTPAVAAALGAGLCAQRFHGDGIGALCRRFVPSVPGIELVGQHDLVGAGGLIGGIPCDRIILDRGVAVGYVKVSRSVHLAAGVQDLYMELFIFIRREICKVENLLMACGGGVVRLLPVVNVQKRGRVGRGGGSLYQRQHRDQRQNQCEQSFFHFTFPFLSIADFFDTMPAFCTNAA